MIRTVIVLAWIALVLGLAAPPLLLWALLGGSVHPMYATARFGLRVAMVLAGLQISFRAGSRQSAASGEDRTPFLLEPTRNYLFMANHVSNVDPPICFLAIPQDIKIIFKKELRWLPVLPAVLRLAGCIPVDRANREAARRAIDQGAAQLKRGDSFLIFPEGTRSRDGSLGPFKSGGFIMSILSGVPVVPLTLRGSQQVQPRGSWRLKPGRVEVVVHEPVYPPASIEEKGAFKKRVKERIESAL
ncbi:MAG: 1-acyl-sn-glycerol-3-phosphate acyltransferase [Acidobacteria bacterium]|nr:1-acyl-sn-glycerol-3-phosphate acyltransferase [Acidobacteriota bacterium]